MEAHQQRVIDEKAELDTKLEKLKAFIEINSVFQNLRDQEQELLRHQLMAMTTYSAILAARIADF